MAISRANTLDKKQLKQLLAYVSRNPTRVVDRVKVLLSFAAGLRAQEIAGIRWDRNVLDAKGGFKTQRILTKKGDFNDVPVLFVGSDIGKYGRERTIVMGPDLAAAMKELKEFRDGNIAFKSDEEEALFKRIQKTEYVVPAGKNRASTELKSRSNALAVWFNRLYDQAGFDGCSSHSGRRSFITEAARQANISGCSLVDVQVLAGHADLGTTQRYVDLSRGQASLVTNLWGG